MFKKPIFQNTINKHRTQDTEHRTQTHVKNVLKVVYKMELFKISVHDRAHFCEMIKTRGNNPMFWSKLHIILNIFINS